MHKYVVSDNQQITPTTLLLTLTKENFGTAFSFQPGQYAAISFYKGSRPSAARCFSIVTSPTDQNLLQFSMRTKGHYTKALTRLKKGDKVNIRGPFGGFVFDSQRDSRAVLLAGGIGITPFMSMVRYAAVTRANNKVDLIYSCQNQDDVPFGEELMKLQTQNPNFTVTFVIGDGPIDKFKGFRTAQGRISPELLDTVVGDHQAYMEPTFFICGPPPFMKGMSKTLQSKAVQKHHIMTEAFSQGPYRQTGKIRNWPFNMYLLTAVGMGFAGFIITVTDLLKTLPPKSLFGSSTTTTATTLTNSRQADLDSLVNNLKSGASTVPESDAVKAAIAASLPTSTVKKPTSTINKTTTPATSSPTNTPTSVPAATPTPAPKKCTTQSGVTTCI